MTATNDDTSSSSSSLAKPVVVCNPVAIDLQGLLEGPPATISQPTTTTTTEAAASSNVTDEDHDHDRWTTLSNSVPYTTARLLVDCRCQLGECCLWDDRNETVVFISILDRTFHKLRIGSTNTTASSSSSSNDDTILQTYHVPKMIGSFALLDREEDDNSNAPSSSSYNDNPGYLVAWQDGFQLYDIEQSKPLSDVSAGPSIIWPRRLNDGRVDPTGTRFICGGVDGGVTSQPAQVFKCECVATTENEVAETSLLSSPSSTSPQEIRHQKRWKLIHTPIVDEISVTNSICWSLDGTTMYLADSPTQQIHRYTYSTETSEASALLSNKQHLHTKPTGNPDGSVVDAEGFLWNATWREGAGRGFVDRIDPLTGQTVFRVWLPISTNDNDKTLGATSEASCCCFGGPNLDILFITTAWEHLDPTTEPHAGGLYAVKLPPSMKGRKEQRFRISS